MLVKKRNNINIVKFVFEPGGAIKGLARFSLTQPDPDLITAAQL